MGISTSTHSLIISTKAEITKLYDILKNLPDCSEGKYFSGCENYKNKIKQNDEGFFEFESVNLGKAVQLNSKLTDLCYLYLDSKGYNCKVNMPLFLDSNGIKYDILVDSVWFECSPGDLDYHIINKKENYDEDVTVETDIYSDDDAYLNPEEITEHIQYAMDLIAACKDKLNRLD